MMKELSDLPAGVIGVEASGDQYGLRSPSR
jgi:hypothetical protein